MGKLALLGKPLWEIGFLTPLFHTRHNLQATLVFVSEANTKISFPSSIKNQRNRPRTAKFESLDMNTELKPRINTDRQGLRSVICLLVVGMICTVLVVMFIAVFAFLSAGIADYFYNARHPIPDPIVRGEDIGLAFVFFISVLGSFLISIPVSFPLLKFFFKKISKIMRCK